MQRLFLTFFYSGAINFAPGTFGTIVALIPAFFILKYLGIQTLFLLSILIFVVSIKIIDDYEKKTKKHDDKHIVIDEVAGVFLACSIAASTSNSILNFILAFVFFRLFDITKPSIIGRVDKGVKGGLGVMLDDMLAGLFAGLLTAVIYGFLLKFDLLLWDLNLKDIF
ncbi:MULTISPECIES: phosphatidylglycerophosphatase A [unclassified Campylobacter]|uniref:phosphatidylglycerophosphatase A family protein n=1 Tax=unclassified Campylobacter TaxID=2593542 RepID=UPI001237E78B|nr:MULTISPECIES: phosphatidylglycerophosphatase A [unclassified Campylobacter]KAA6227247.1 phosphatidylglycerophosphatase A [Campylobacter sp. LR286c]KAA6227880.1 phosphatidylglycerophosphatase A [Campylobacter sp. LR185c]KAA6228288.1 phosphatidylglycerophosphatase A [Campylobacter sp. LR196d]KAA6229290.1 phosphatidylglycerophosphatase A [Campylobacter sp. LR291e]KAA6231096.1 phosphatidylglycerophosphatase A [Campylobacter sp. LR264d]